MNRTGMIFSAMRALAIGGILAAGMVHTRLFAQNMQAQNRQMRPQGGSMQMGKLFSQQQARLQEFLAEEAAEGKEFMNSMQGKPKSELIQALKEFKTRQYEKNSAFRQQMHEERIAAFDNAMAERPGARPEMREHALARFTKSYEEFKAFFAGKHQENMDFLDKVGADSSLEGQALNEKLQAFFQAQKESAKAFMDQKKGQRQNQGQP